MDLSFTTHNLWFVSSVVNRQVAFVATCARSDWLPPRAGRDRADLAPLIGWDTVNSGEWVTLCWGTMMREDSVCCNAPVRETLESQKQTFQFLHRVASTSGRQIVFNSRFFAPVSISFEKLTLINEASWKIFVKIIEEKRKTKRKVSYFTSKGIKQAKWYFPQGLTQKKRKRTIVGEWVPRLGNKNKMAKKMSKWTISFCVSFFIFLCEGLSVLAIAAKLEGKLLGQNASMVGKTRSMRQNKHRTSHDDDTQTGKNVKPGILLRLLRLLRWDCEVGSPPPNPAKQCFPH